MNIKKTLIILISIFIVLELTDINDILYAKMNTLKNKVLGIENRLDLHKYEVEIEAKKIKEIKKNLSGITYNKDTNTLFAITNSPRNIHELSLDGKHLRLIDLDGFKDTEGITYLGDNKYAVVDEKKQRAYIFKIDKNTKEINASKVMDTITVKINSQKNMGFEGVAYDKQEQTLFIVNEKFPLKLIQISQVFQKSNLSINLENDLTSMNHFMDDFSGLHFDENTRHLLFLSDESKSLAEISLKGEQISFADFEKGFLGLKDSIPQAEGVTMDDEGTLYIVSEPNLFYTFKKKR